MRTFNLQPDIPTPRVLTARQAAWTLAKNLVQLSADGEVAPMVFEHLVPTTASIDLNTGMLVVTFRLGDKG